ncbi:ester cyclase [Smaragdicoccus niigatensis]
MARMGAVENRELVCRWIDGWNANDTAAVLGDVYAEDWIDGDSAQGPHGHDGVRAFVDAYLGAFPDLQIKILQLVADDEFVALRWSANGTHTGPLYGRPPSMASVSFTGHTMHRIAHGKIAATWLQVDTTGLFNQLR